MNRLEMGVKNEVKERALKSELDQTQCTERKKMKHIIKASTKEKKLANEIAKIMSLVLVIIFVILIGTTIVISSNATNSAIEGQFSNLSRASGQQIQSIFETAESAAYDMESYLLKAYRLGGEGKKNMAGEAKAGVEETTYYSNIYKTKFAEMGSDVEKYITETARNVVMNNLDIIGIGIMFEPYTFDPLIKDYAFYVDDSIGKDDEIKPYGSYETYSKENFYQAASQTGEAVFTDPYIYNNINMITYSAPVLYENKVQAVIMADISIDNFKRVVTTNEKYPSMYTTIYNQEGNIIFNSKNKDSIGKGMETLFTNSNEALEVKNAMSSEIPFVIETKMADGQNTTGYYEPIIVANQTWWVFTALNTSERNISMLIMLVTLLAMSFAALAVMIIVIIILLRKNLKPIDGVVKAAESIAAGDLEIELSKESNDEIGKLAEAFGLTTAKLKLIIEDINYLLSEMANGNFNIRTTTEESYIGSYENILMSIRKLNRTLSATLKKINGSSEHVALGSAQMAESAQALAEGATDQAGSIEELQATIISVVEQVKASASQSEAAYKKCNEVETEAQSSSKEMDDMTRAMQRISETSNEIGNIIGDIEDIATQTNLLSLNAAIEAARAGEAGKGFAVVADQIGKLAEDSAKSAVRTRQMIETAISEVSTGNQITERTAASLEQVITGLRMIAKGAEAANESSVQQAMAMEQIELGVDQISGVVQNNSAAAEETSATSEELSAQAVTLSELVGKFVLRD